MFGKSVLLSILAIFFAASLNAAQMAEVIVDGAMVYKKGDFGAPVLGYLRKGKKVKISNKTYGPFHKVKLRQGIIGYISDIDIRILGKRGGKTRASRKRSGIKRKRSARVNSYWGVSVGSVDYTDRIPITVGSETVDTPFNSQTLFVFLNRTTPFSWLDGAVNLDLSVGISTGTPSIYTDLSANSSGYVMLADSSLLMPFHGLSGKNFFTYFGAGLFAVHSVIDLDVSGTTLPIGKTKIGGSFTGGAAFQIKKFLLKVEPKYYLEEERYLGFHFGLQRAF